MRGLPELLTIVEELCGAFEEPSKPSIPSLPVVFIEQRPTLRALARPIGRQIVRKPCPNTTRTEVAKPEQQQQDFSVAFDVSCYQPEEISVRMRDRDIIVEAKHEERQDEHGYVSRQFTRRYTLPADYDPDTVSTYLNADGKMTIKALKPQSTVPHERIVPIKRVAQEEEVGATKRRSDPIESAGEERSEGSVEETQQQQQEP